MGEELLAELSDSRSMAAIAQSFVRHAKFLYRIGPSDAEDLVQSAVATYLEVGARFTRVPSHHALLFGIFRKKCLEHIERSVREKRRIRRMCERTDVARDNPWIRPSRPAQAPSVLESLIGDEDRRSIVQAVAALRPSSQQLASLISDDGLTRQDLLKLTRLNENTLDSRLHVCRAELRARLRERSLHGMQRATRPAGPESSTTAFG
jgi:RNA polymerase sigma factor (sigma-70 family)